MALCEVLCGNAAALWRGWVPLDIYQARHIASGMPCPCGREARVIPLPEENALCLDALPLWQGGSRFESTSQALRLGDALPLRQGGSRFASTQGIVNLPATR